MSPYSLPALLAFVADASLVTIILLDNLKSRTHRLFALLVLCFVLWDIGDIIIVNSTTLNEASIGGVIIMTAILFASTFFLLLSFSFPRAINFRFNHVVTIPLVLLAPFAFSILCGLQICEPLQLRAFSTPGMYYYMANAWAGVLNAAVYVYVLASLLWGVTNYLMQFRQSRLHKVRLQVLSVLLGAIVLVLMVVALLTFHEYPEVHLYAAWTFYLLMGVLLSYIVLGSKLIVTRRIGRQGLTYFLVTGFVFGFYLIVIRHIAELCERQFNTTSIVFEGLLILVFSVLIRPFVVRVQSLIEHLFYQDIFRYRQRFIRFSQESFNLPSLGDLAKAVEAFLRESLSVSTFDMMVRDEDSAEFRSILEPGRALSLADCLPQLSRRERSTYEVDELMNLCSDADRKFLAEFIGGCVVSLPAEVSVRGILLIGPTFSGRPYSTDDVEFFAFFANGVSIAVEHNVLRERMRSEEIRVSKIEKLAALGRLTAGIAHEFRNPLNIISTSAQTILRNPDNLSLRSETGKYIIEETERLSRTVDEFLQFAKPHTPIWARGSMDDVINSVIHALQGQAAARNVRLRKVVIGPIPPITTSHQHIERALINLGLNGIEAMLQGGELTILLEPKDTSVITISVRDTGPGIPPEYHARLFDPFFTTKPSGTGLGLVIAYMMVETVGGKISFTTSSEGTTFYIELPIDGSQQ